MANDGSLASLVEAWIVTQIKAISEIPADNVEVFEGTTSPTGDQLIREFTANRSPYVTVLFEGDVPKTLEEGEQAYDPTYAIYIVVQNKRPGAARKGDGDTAGTNLMRDRLRNALHNKFPKQSANGYYTDGAEFRGVQVVFQRKDAFIMRAEVVVRETPTAI